MRKTAKLGLLVAIIWTAWAGPVDFGKQELDRAIADKKLSPVASRVVAEVIDDAAESFRILPGQVSGGDIRGLMYGLIEAAEQIRGRGQLVALRGSPATRIRGVRLFIRPDDMQQEWYNSRAGWQEFCATLARSHLNRLNLVFAAQPNVDTLRFISQTATDYGVDFTLGLEKDLLDAMDSGALKSLLAACPTIRSVQAASYRDWLFGAIREAGRRVTVELREPDLTPELVEAASQASLPLRVIRMYGAPVVPGASDVIWQMPRQTQGNDPAFVRETIMTISAAELDGFEIEPPQLPLDEGIRPFYMLWGRLSYNPKGK